MDSGDDRYSTSGAGPNCMLIPGPASALIDSKALLTIEQVFCDPLACSGGALQGREINGSSLPISSTSREPMGRSCNSVLKS
jgi:hypothetical protein